MTSGSNNLVRTRRGGFTLIELMVAVSILVIVILAVGSLFQTASRAVGLSQASLDMLSGVRAVQPTLERDIAGMDKTAFLVIRCQLDPSNAVDPVTGAIRRFDQVSFLSRGSFPHRTGSTAAGKQFADTTTSPEAFVWWGQLAMAKAGGSIGAPTNSSIYILNNQANKVPLNQVPTGTTDGDFILGRSTTILFPQDSAAGSVSSPNGLSIAAFQNNTTVVPPLAAIDYNAKAVTAPASGEGSADITASRVDAAATTSADIMNYLRQAIGLGGDRTASGIVNRYEADHYCYRYGALRSPYDSGESSDQIINGYFRMHPIALQGVSSFAIDWTNGLAVSTTDVGGGFINVQTGNPFTTGDVGSLKWYGLYGLGGGVSPGGVASTGVTQIGFVDHGFVGTAGTTATVGGGVGAGLRNGDSYTAIFSYDNPDSTNNKGPWPVALRFRYHVVDPTGRIPNGRDFVQVVSLPN